MEYREFGNSGVRLSALGFGAMRLPWEDEDEAVRMIQHAIESGVNYVDTGKFYGKGRSEAICGRAIKPYRDRVYLSTKNYGVSEDATAKDWRGHLDLSLKECDTDYFDFYQIMWGANWREWEVLLSRGGLEMMQKAKEQGLVRRLCCSFHDKPENMIRLLDTGELEGMTVQYNFLDRANEPGIAHARRVGKGIIVMGPVGGGRLGYPSPEVAKLLPGKSLATPDLALRFVLANPGVTVALSGMSTMQQVEENLRTANTLGEISGGEYQRIAAALEEKRKLADLYCTGCGYCMPCPNGVNIPRVFELMNYHRVYGLTAFAQEQYATMKSEAEKPEKPEKLSAAACVECGECEPKCPQKIPIVEQLKESHGTLKVS
jgi:hypothetical protein